MKVLDLGCAHGHVFEGWFASEDDFQSQRERGLIECPVCGDQSIDKRLSAPYVQTRRASEPTQRPVQPSKHENDQTPVVAADARPSPLTPAQQARLLQALRELARNTEDVGDRFASEALAMHHGEMEERAIRGVATPQQAIELLEEGVPLLPLPDPALLDGPLQ